MLREMIADEISTDRIIQCHNGLRRYASASGHRTQGRLYFLFLMSFCCMIPAAAPVLSELVNKYVEAQITYSVAFEQLHAQLCCSCTC